MENRYDNLMYKGRQIVRSATKGSDGWIGNAAIPSDVGLSLTLFDGVLDQQPTREEAIELATRKAIEWIDANE